MEWPKDCGDLNAGENRKSPVTRAAKRDLKRRWLNLMMPRSWYASTVTFDTVREDNVR